MKLTHVRLLVDNYEECFLFYRDTLGFEVTWGDEYSNYADFKGLGDATLGLFERKQMAEAIGGIYDRDAESYDTTTLVFKVDDVEEAYHHWKEKVSFITTPTEQRDWGIKVVHFRDPAGNLIELYEPIPGSI
ncbi:Catechol 2,3-dioxygenase [Thalassobacillus cyri]|uniref:Catechol 2,3-dioxygenase n=1 Tax=Thalassobacillus cyri TaxID=571932 RepID=A0A1H3XKT4_9BACI|nr:VOC family protein [Thalassobacillus cyri]SEA00075.1 Catechol 2,3-dioxygenase [Thalassobacillus cyri]